MYVNMFFKCIVDKICQSTFIIFIHITLNRIPKTMFLQNTQSLRTQKLFDKMFNSDNLVMIRLLCLNFVDDICFPCCAGFLFTMELYNVCCICDTMNKTI